MYQKTQKSLSHYLYKGFLILFAQQSDWQNNRILYGVSVEMPRGEGFITVGVFENIGVAKLEAKILIDSFQPTNLASTKLAI
ncbi:MAG: hypothetical protein F6J86_01175 [Symploca sp. SIO1B1]|nr:hypothetical protein [Symploca sp. SIO2D2]NER19657.1 hypothetical protein [Symploca sp. SIO1C2]NER49116.1 hypothetical protein [Symploca sp. SIO1A3]NER92475.1 hypothetical protein [Symploca sp. SIO1B1]